MRKKYVLFIVLIAMLLTGCGSNSTQFKPFKENEFSQITMVEVNNLVTLNSYSVTDLAELDSICTFLQNIQGLDGINSKEFYGGGTYRINLYNEEKIQDSIIFYCKDQFDYGDFGNGYPVRYSSSTPTSREVVEFFCQYDEEYDPEDWSEEYLYP